MCCVVGVHYAQYINANSLSSLFTLQPPKLHAQERGEPAWSPPSDRPFKQCAAQNSGGTSFCLSEIIYFETQLFQPAEPRV